MTEIDILKVHSINTPKEHWRSFVTYQKSSH